MKNILDTTSSLISLLILVLILPIISIIAVILYSHFFKASTIYESHHTHTPYPSLIVKDVRQKAIIEKGAYLAKVGNCISCHTDTKRHKPAFAGGLLLDTPFGGIYSTNITPDNETGIGTWSEAAFVKAMTKGIAPNGKHYFPAFPYPYFAIMTPSDLHALFLYLKSLPPIKQKNLSNPVPYGLPFARKSMLLWNDLFFSDQLAYPNASKTDKSLRRGAYLVNGLGHCGLCHTPLNMFGAPEKKYHLSGRFIGGYWAPNITSTGLRHTSLNELLKTFNESRLLNNAGPVAGPMTDVTLNSLQYLTKEDQFAIARYLKAVKSLSRLSVEPDHSLPTLDRGKQIYKKVCVICHQSGKMGAPRIGNGSGWLSRLKRHGIHTFYNRTVNGFNSMPAYGACVGCTTNDIKAAVNYMIYESIPYSKWRVLNKH